MGYMKHNAIVVTSWNPESINKAADKATEIGMQVIGPSDPVVNGYRSMLVCPDGSKEGWEDSDAGDERRSLFRKWLDEQQYADGSTSYHWVELTYGGDYHDATVVAHAWEGGTR